MPDITSVGASVFAESAVTNLVADLRPVNTFFLRNFGAKGDGQFVIDGAITTGTAILTSASGKFVAGDVGKQIAIEGASSNAAFFNCLGAKILSYQSPTQVTLDTNATQSSVNSIVTWGTNDSPAFAGAIAAAALVATANTPATIIVTPGRYIVGQSNTDYIDLSQASTADYISLMGTDKFSCIIDRPNSQGVGNALAQAANHCRISNLTIMSKVSRLIHWDQGIAGALGIFDNLILPKGGGGNGISTGVTGGTAPLNSLTSVSTLVVANNIMNVNASCHNGTIGDGSVPKIFFLNNTTLANAGTFLGIDIASGGAGGCSLMVYMYGNSSEWFEVDISAWFSLTSVDANPAFANIYTDGALRTQAPAGGVNKFWNYFHYTPQLARGYYISGNATTEAAVMVYSTSGDNLIQTITKGDLFPVVIAAQSSGMGAVPISYAPMLCTGVFAEVTCDLAIVGLNDVIVTSATAQQATADNTQIDIRRILGWAIQTKAAGASGRVRIRRNTGVPY